MSTTPDRDTLMIICDHAEESGFDPEQVGLLRLWADERTRPKVDDVLLVAMEYHRENPDGLARFFNGNNDTDEYLNEQLAVRVDLPDAKGERLIRLLLRMSPSGRGKLRRKVTATANAEAGHWRAPTRETTSSPEAATFLSPEAATFLRLRDHRLEIVNAAGERITTGINVPVSPCTRCRNTGRIILETPGIAEARWPYVDCPECHGSGFINR